MFRSRWRRRSKASSKATNLAGIIKIAVVCCLALSCGRAMQSNHDPTGRIEAVCGGGFAAVYHGVAIHDDGRAFRIQRGPGKSERETELHSDPQAFADWSRRLDEAHFDQLAYDHPGNMTCSLERVQSGKQHRVSWHMEQRPPEAIEAIFREIEARHKSAEDL